MRFVVDHCVPAQVATLLRQEGHDAWTAYEANLQEATDESLIIYADDSHAVLVTINKDCAHLARVMRAASVVFLRGPEMRSQELMRHALEWLEANKLPDGRVLKVFVKAAPVLMSPLA